MTDSILIVGSGVAGLHAAMECADAGAQTLVIEQGPVVGGRLAAAMTNASAIGDRAEGESVPLFAALTENENIEIMTLSNLERIDGRPGNFTVSIRERARFVTDACTRCKLCHKVCPVVVPNEFDAGLTFRKAIHTPMSETLPPEYVIDIQNCLNAPPNYLPCQQCVDVCEDDAILFDLPVDTVHERHVGAVLLAPGLQTEDGTAYTDLGYGTHADIVTSAEMQRLLESPGPTGGYASKPSNEEYPDSVLMVLDNPSPFALYIVASQVHQLLEQDVGTVVVLVLSQLSQESEQAQALQLAERLGVTVRWGGIFKAEPGADAALDVSYEDFSAHRFVRETYDMIVLCSDVQPASGLDELSALLGIELDDSGYIKVDGGGVETSQPGIFVAGCGSGAKNIKDSIASAHAGAAGALACLDQRLLRTTDTKQTVTEKQQIGVPPEDETRARIEKMLYALLDQSAS